MSTIKDTRTYGRLTLWILGADGLLWLFVGTFSAGGGKVFPAGGPTLGAILFSFAFLLGIFAAAYILITLFHAALIDD